MASRAGPTDYPGGGEMSGGLYRSATRTRMVHGAARRRSDLISADRRPSLRSRTTAPPPEAPRETAPPRQRGHGVGSLVSRGTGFLRTVVIGAALGGLAGRRRLHDGQFLPGHDLRVPARRHPDQRAGAGAGPRAARATPTGARRTPSGCSPSPCSSSARPPCSRWSCAPLLAMASTPAARRRATSTWSRRCRYLMLPMIFFYGLAGADRARC